MTSPAAAPEHPASAIPARARGRRILHDWRLLGLLLAGGLMATIVVFVVGFSDAFFTSTSSDQGSTVSAGELRLTQSKTGAIWTDSLRPGDVKTGTITLTNAEHKARLTLGVSGLSDTPPGPTLADVIVVTVRETSPSTVQRYKGKLKDDEIKLHRNVTDIAEYDIVAKRAKETEAKVGSKTTPK